MGVGEDPAVEFLADDVVEGAFGEGEVEFAGEAFAVEAGEMALPTGGSWASSPTRMMRLPGAWRQNWKRSERRSR